MLIDALSNGYMRLREDSPVDARVLTDWWPGKNFGMALSDTYVEEKIDAEKALGLSALFAVVNRIASTISMLPLYVYKRRADGGRDQAVNHPLFKVLVGKVNRDMIPSVWKKLVILQLLLGGNCFLEQITDGRGDPRELMVLDPSRVSYKRNEDGYLDYYLQKKGSSEKIKLDRERITHIRILSADGITGLSPVTLARHNIALGISLLKFHSKLIANDATPRGLLKTADQIGPEAREKLRSEWEKIYRGTRNRGKIGILDFGLEFQALGLSLKDAQFVESEKFQAEEIARWYGVPPHKIGLLDKATFSNISEQNLEYLIDAIAPLLVLIEEAITIEILRPKEQGIYFVQFGTDSLTKTDPKTRDDAAARRLLSGSATINEIRAQRNENPIDGGDVLLIPSSHTTIENFKAEKTDKGSDSGSSAQGEDNGAGSDADPSQGGQESAGMDNLWTVRAIEPLVRDQVERICRREYKTVKHKFRQMARKGSINEFQQWHQDWLNREHEEYLRDALKPVSDTVGLMSNTDPDKLLEDVIERSLFQSLIDFDALLDPIKNGAFEASLKVIDDLEEKRSGDLVDQIFQFAEGDEKR